MKSMSLKTVVGLALLAVLVLVGTVSNTLGQSLKAEMSDGADKSEIGRAHV